MIAQNCICGTHADVCADSQVTQIMRKESLACLSKLLTMQHLCPFSVTWIMQEKYDRSHAMHMQSCSVACNIL